MENKTNEFRNPTSINEDMENIGVQIPEYTEDNMYKIFMEGCKFREMGGHHQYFQQLLRQYKTQKDDNV